MRDLRISLIQGATRWHDPEANRAGYGQMIADLAGKTDLVVLPETFTSGFSNAAIEQAETMQGPTLDWLHEQAGRLDAAVTGSVQVREQDAVYNRMLFVMPDGKVQTYDKRHLFRYADEHQRYAAGQVRTIVHWRDWRILLQVCYDLRFPVFSRNRAGVSCESGMDYDLLLYVANWPTPRRQHWRSLLRARAIENLACCVGVNRVGTDGNGLTYSGDSVALDAAGNRLLELGAQEQVATVCLDAAALNDWRRHFPAWMDADDFILAPGDD